MKKTILFTLIGVSLVLVGCLQQTPTGNQNVNQPVVNQNQNVNQPIVDVNQNTNQPAVNVNQNLNTNQPVDPTANWQTYQNDKYRFEFKYPGDAIIENIFKKIDDEVSYNGLGLTINELKIHLSIANTGEAYSLYHGSAPTKKMSKSTKRLGNIDVEKSIVFGYQILPNGTWVLSYKFSNQNDDYKFITWIDGVEGTNPIPKSTENLMEQILSTFKFTK